MATSLLNLVDNLTEGIHKIKCKDCDCFLEYKSVKHNLIKNKDLSVKIIQTKFDEGLKKRFKNAFKFFNDDIKKFVLLLKRGAYL